MKESRRTFIKQGALATIATFSAGSLLWTNMGCAMAQENAQVLEAMKNDASAAKAVDKVNASNQVPYISTYFITPKVNVGESAVINYYLTDYDQKEYMKDDHSETFTVDYWVNGAKTTLQNVKAGDNSVTLKSIPKGKVLFALQATDNQGRKTHRLYEEFLMVNPADANIPKDKILTPDLKKFNIYNDDTHPVETSAGLTAMLKWASDNGYRKALLPQGRYRLDENSTVEMATKLTLDMNGSTFKLNPNALDKARMFEMFQCEDSHVINGTFEGDLKEHVFKDVPHNAEWVNGIYLGQDCKYCSFKDVKIVDVPGTGSSTGMGGNGTRVYSADPRQWVGSFVPGDISAQGEPLKSEARTTSEKLVDISPFIASHGFIQIGLYLGYQGNPAGNWVYKAHFYDADQKYIETIEGYMYRRLYPPRTAKYVRVTLLSNATPKELRIFNIRGPYNCAFINVRHENVRCVGMAPVAFTNLLVEGNTFENCGWSAGKCAFDSEDGWDMMQDLTFRNNVFGTNPNNEFLTAAGHNFVIENNTMKVYMWDRTKSAVFRNNKIKAAGLRFGDRNRSGYPRISGNTFAGRTDLIQATKTPDCDFAIRDNVLEKDALGTTTQSDQAAYAYFYRCQINGGELTGKFVTCAIKDVIKRGKTLEIYDSTVDNCQLYTSGKQLISTIAGSTITNSKLRVQQGTIVLKSNTIRETSCSAGGNWSPDNEYILSGNKIETSLPYLVSIGNSYKQVVLDDDVITSTNPDFIAVLLDNPIKKDLLIQSVSIYNTTFNANGGTAFELGRWPNGKAKLPDAAATLTVNLFGNVYNGIAEMGKDLAEAPKIKIVRSKPAL